MPKTPWDNDDDGTLKLAAGKKPQPKPAAKPDGGGTNQNGPAASVHLPEAERRSLFASLFGAAAKYCALSTASPTIPAAVQLPLHRRIALMRGLRGWKQRDLAREAEVTQTDVSNAEKGALAANSLPVTKILRRLETPG